MQLCSITTPKISPPASAILVRFKATTAPIIRAIDTTDTSGNTPSTALVCRCRKRLHSTPSTIGSMTIFKISINMAEAEMSSH